MLLHKPRKGAAAFAAIALLAGCSFVCGAKAFAQNTAMGQAEFHQTGGKIAFTVPEGVTRIRAFVYGAGGGAGSTVTASHPGFNGGSGAFVQAVLDVVPGAKLYVIVGAGGAGGAPHTVSSGKAGGASQILNASDEVLVSAGGGGGGTNCCVASSDVGAAGTPGTAPAGSILHPGSSGDACGGGQTRCGYFLPSLTTDADLGGRGFNNGSVDDTETIDGIQGYVLFEW